MSGAGGLSGLGRFGGAGTRGPELLDDRYRLVEQLGAGGMSVVWRGYDEVLGRPVAVKVLAARLAADRAFRHRIRVEAQAVARLSHPHIAGVYDYGEAVRDGVAVPYVVMELVDGESLAARLGRQGRLPWPEAVTAGAEVAAALAAAHARGVVHRDVTPGNVMLTVMGAKVVDFGILALAGERDVGPDGRLLGTPAYLAPERLDGGQVSPATDVYAVGLLLYRMLTGRLPWRAETTTQMLRAHMYRDPDPMPPPPGLPAGVAGLVERCLGKEPADRPGAAELARGLASAAGVAVAVPAAPGPAGGSPRTAPVGPAVDASAGTTILPWSTATGAPGLAGSGARSSPLAGDRLRTLAVAAGLVALTGLVWAGATAAPSRDGAEPDRANLAMPRPDTCRVDYALRRDAGGAFDADLTVTNTGVEPVRDWTLTFAFPGDQVLTGSPSSVWRQQGSTVTVRPAGGAADPVLPAGGAARFTLAGTYADANPLPVEFRLGDTDCQARVSGAAGGGTDAGGAAVGVSRPATSPPAEPAPRRPADPPRSGAEPGHPGESEPDASKGKGPGKDRKPKPDRKKGAGSDD